MNSRSSEVSGPYRVFIVPRPSSPIVPIRPPGPATSAVWGSKTLTGTSSAAMVSARAPITRAVPIVWAEVKAPPMPDGREVLRDARRTMARGPPASALGGRGGHPRGVVPATLVRMMRFRSGPITNR
jgi:hypothetical protein